MSEAILTTDEAHRLIVNALICSRTSAENAEIVADALVKAELAGQGGHGLRRVPAYAAQARAGKVDGFAVPKATRTRPGAVHIDAGNGFSYPALQIAIEYLRDIIPQQGIGIAGIYRSHHAGVAGVTAEALARGGIIALMFANAPAAMAPWGARKPLFGTNPIAFACPVAGEDPIVVDVSLSRVARGKLMAAAQKGETIPQGWAFDPDGNPTTDPKAGMAGTMAPLGDAKGTALALMVELLCAGLTGANYAYQASSFFDDKGPAPGTGQSLIAIDPSCFGDTNALARFCEMAQIVAASEGARLPGRRRQEIRARLAKDGIPADPKLIAEIRAIIAAGQKDEKTEQ